MGEKEPKELVKHFVPGALARHAHRFPVTHHLSGIIGFWRFPFHLQAGVNEEHPGQHEQGRKYRLLSDQFLVEGPAEK